MKGCEPFIHKPLMVILEPHLSLEDLFNLQASCTTLWRAWNRRGDWEQALKMRERIMKRLNFPMYFAFRMLRDFAWYSCATIEEKGVTNIHGLFFCFGGCGECPETELQLVNRKLCKFNCCGRCYLLRHPDVIEGHPNIMMNMIDTHTKANKLDAKAFFDGLKSPGIFIRDILVDNPFWAHLEGTQFLEYDEDCYLYKKSEVIELLKLKVPEWGIK